ncbi:hotdog fold thioesterase [Gulosibacter sp. 10]|uniref:hotdog fold thioesterase n=1 Tax=Gulosibacter sp. 10 TaxID=1255570 RepID=UPI00097E9009|nr:hotdog fold thioesterase [Gulosibacter sp. 10]SJM65742.1 Phenylacetic acid degradation protein PaaD, thioesterase [Gulosibacter sp. 10]
MTTEPTPVSYGSLARGHRILEDDFASRWMGIRVLESLPGEAVLEMELRREMLNGFAIAHGGMVFAFADTAFALACNSHEDDGTITVASGVDVNFLRPAVEGQTLTAHAKAVHEGRSGVYDIEVFARGPEDEEPVRIMLFRGRSRTIPKPRA